jgi:PAS domain S-box-containing protein
MQHVTVNAADLASSDRADAIRVLHVDDDPSMLEVSKQILMMEGNFEIDHAGCVDEALKKLETQPYDVVISDYEMPERDGLQFLKELREQKNAISFILFTGKGREEVAIKALNLGADGYYNKQGSPETVYGELSHGIQQVVKRKQAEKKLGESEHITQKILQITPNLIYIYDLIEHRNAYTNKNVLDFLGYTPLQVEAMNSELFANLIHPDDAETVAKHHARFANAPDNTMYELEYRMKHSNGEWRWLRSRDILFARTKEGIGKQIMGSCEDITAQKKAEEELRLSEERMVEAQSISHLGSWDWNIETGQDVWSSEQFRIFGFEPYSFQPSHDTFLKALHRDDYQRVSDAVEEVMKGKKAFDIECRVMRPNGETRYVYCKGEIYRNSQGKPIRMLGTVLDITERRKVLEEITEKHLLLQEVFNSADASIFSLDKEYHYTGFNSAHALVMKQIYGVDIQIGKDFFDCLIVVGDREKAKKNIDRALLGEQFTLESYSGEEKLSRKYFLISHSPVKGLGGQVIGVVVVSKDISDRKKVEQEFARVNEQLKVVGKLTRHDVRNKLSAISGYSYLLKSRHADQADIVEGLGQMGHSVKEIERILEYAKTYEQIGAKDLSYVNVENALNEAVTLFSGSLPRIINKCQGLTIFADSFLRQLFYNFVDNTRKYGEKTTTIKIYFEMEGEDHLNLIYEDDGVGISFENKLKLFSQGFSTGGSTGFGLFLSKKMIEVYGWEIKEIGEPGKGAKFVMTIPKINKNGQANYQIQS